MAKNSHLGQKKQQKIPSVILRTDFKINRYVFFKPGFSVFMSYHMEQNFQCVRQKSYTFYYISFWASQNEIYHSRALYIKKRQQLNVLTITACNSRLYTVIKFTCVQ